MWLTNREVADALKELSATLGRGFQAIDDRLSDLLIEVEQISIELHEVKKVLALRKPGPLRFRYLRQDKNMTIFFDINLPALAVTDIEKRELTLTVGDKEPVTVTIEGDALHTLKSPEFSGQPNETLSATLVDIDGSGNRSEAQTASDTIKDTFAPPKPGVFSFNYLRQENPVPPVVDPVVPPTPPTE